jgi:hypothetical protein
MFSVNLVSKNPTAVDVCSEARRFKRKRVHTDDCELDRHKEPDYMVNDLQHRPSLHAKQFPCTWGQYKSVPCSNGECADEKVLVCAKMRGKVERRRQKRSDIAWTSAGSHLGR